jgi:dTDP-4-amino-4,6-dideoxygalactose transaminase
LPNLSKDQEKPMINVTKTFLPSVEEYLSYLYQIWDSKWLTNRGKLVVELESKLKEYLEIEHILAVNNGTIALQIAIKALELKGEIITTPFSYVATVSSIVWENCKPVFVDIDEKFLTIDESMIEEAITDRTTAILATHVFGNPCNVEVIQAIAKKHGLKVIYDAAHCFDVRYKGESILNWGDISTLSFHATKLFHTGEGGGIICRDKSLANKIFYHHNFGHRGEEEFSGLGINAKISELSAAMGLSILPYIDEIIAERKQICSTYDSLLTNINIRKLNLRDETKWNYSYYPVIFSSEEILLKTKQMLNEQGIFPRRYFYPSLNKLPYLEYQEKRIAEKISKQILCLPLYPNLKNQDIEKICQIINEVC